MPYRNTSFNNQSFYHIYNRGVEKREVFSNDRDFQRFFETLYYYQFAGPKPRFSTHRRFKVKDFSKNPKIIDIVAYCLMPNHFHILIRQLKEDGLKEFLSKVTNSYTKYFNTKHNRVGPLFQGEFKAVLIETDEQLLHLSRYIHLNPYVSNLTQDLKTYTYSSYPVYVGLRTDSLSVTDPVLAFFKKAGSYQGFVTDHAGYASDLEQLKHRHLLIED